MYFAQGTKTKRNDGEINNELGERIPVVNSLVRSEV